MRMRGARDMYSRNRARSALISRERRFGQAGSSSTMLACTSKEWIHDSWMFELDCVLKIIVSHLEMFTRLSTKSLGLLRADIEWSVVMSKERGRLPDRSNHRSKYAGRAAALQDARRDSRRLVQNRGCEYRTFFHCLQTVAILPNVAGSPGVSTNASAKIMARISGEKSAIISPRAGAGACLCIAR